MESTTTTEATTEAEPKAKRARPKAEPKAKRAKPKAKPAKPGRKQLTLPGVPEDRRPPRGNPLMQFRVERATLAAFCRKHGGRENAIVALRRHMERAA